MSDQWGEPCRALGKDLNWFILAGTHNWMDGLMARRLTCYRLMRVRWLLWKKFHQQHSFRIKKQFRWRYKTQTLPVAKVKTQQMNFIFKEFQQNLLYYLNNILMQLPHFNYCIWFSLKQSVDIWPTGTNLVKQPHKEICEVYGQSFSHEKMEKSLLVIPPSWRSFWFLKTKIDCTGCGHLREKNVLFQVWLFILRSCSKCFWRADLEPQAGTLIPPPSWMCQLKH